MPFVLGVGADEKSELRGRKLLGVASHAGDQGKKEEFAHYFSV